MKSSHPLRPRLAFAIPAALFTFVLLFSLALLTDDDDSLPSCPASRSGAVDIVASGARPCVLHAPAGAGAAPGVGTGHATVPGGSGKKTSPAKSSGSVAKQPKAPAAPKAPAPKAPAMKVPTIRR